MNPGGTTVFLTTHQIEEANQLCDRVAIINHGEIAAMDTPERLKQAFQKVQLIEVALEPAVANCQPGGGVFWPSPVRKLARCVTKHERRPGASKREAGDERQLAAPMSLATLLLTQPAVDNALYVQLSRVI